MTVTPLRRMTRTQLVAAVRTMQAERDRAIARAHYWRDQHAHACDRLTRHHCDPTCAPGAHHECDPHDCHWNACACPCHHHALTVGGDGDDGDGWC